MFGYPAIAIENDSDDDNAISVAKWVLVTRNSRFLKLPLLAKDEIPIISPPGLRPWTDDYNNLFRILKPVKLLKQDTD
jgi:hypothetical protein